MSRIVIGLSLLLLLLAGAIGTGEALASPTAAQQSGWNGLKKRVRLDNGVTLAYVELGNPRGEPLLLLHGYTDTSRSWSLMAPYLAKYRLLIPDQRGHGAADAPACCYSTHVYADDARQFMDALDISRATLIGHSLGSMVAITMAAEYPDRVGKIVLIGSTALTPVRRGDWLFDNAVRVTARPDPNSEFMRDWHPRNQPTPVDPVFAEAVFQELLDVPPHVWRGVMRELADVPVGRHSADVRAPVMIISGGKDPLFPAEHHRSLVEAFPGGEAMVFPDLGHNPLWEEPEAIGRAIASFLDRQEGAAD